MAESAASSASPGTKRPADPSAKEEVPSHKKTFIERSAGAFKSILPPSPPGDTSASADEEQSQEAAEIAAEKSQQGIVVQAIKELNGPSEKEATEDAAAFQSRRAEFLSKVVDQAAAVRRAREEEAEFEDSSFNMNIRPQDEDWINTREFFVKELKAPTKTPMEIFEKDFTKVQILYLMPRASDAGMILKVQQEQTKKYKEALGPTGRFRGIPDNLATKLTMLHFGLPIEPATLYNITISSEDGDRTCPPDDPLEPPPVQRIMYAEKPLQFLDKYSEGRSHGYPMLRRAKQRDLAPTTAPSVPTATAPPPTSPVDNHGPGHVRGHHGHGNPQVHRHEPFINQGKSPVSMRGGALPAYAEDGNDEEGEAEDEYYIYGYNGRFICQDDLDSFQKTALRLLGYDLKTSSPWGFCVDLYEPDAKIPTTIYLSSRQTMYSKVFRDEIQPFLSRDRRVFVRAGMDTVDSGGMLEPCRKGMKDVVRLVGDGDGDGSITYWKIPKDLKPNNGINQCQPGFFSAMKLLFSDDPLPPQGLVELRFGGASEAFNLGWGGMEATVELWNAVCEAFSKLDPAMADSIELFVGTKPAEPEGDFEMGAHLSGSKDLARASFTNPEHTYDEIEGMLKTWTRAPVAFRIWHNALERESGTEGEVIQLKPRKKAIEKLRKFFEGWQGQTNCCWFRPEWKKFTVGSLDLDPPKEVHWPGAPAIQELGILKSILQSLLGANEALDSFTLLEAQSEQDGRRFVVTEDTTDQEWRMHIYDWLHTNNLFFQKNTNIAYVLDQSPWGISPPIIALAVSPKVTSQPTPIEEAMTSSPDMIGLRKSSLTVQAPPRMNRERITRFPAGRVKSQKWSDWMTEQHFQDGLQRRSWIKDQSIIEPGRLPAPPFYGATRELQLRVGSSMPTIYAQRLTPTDIRQLQDENQKLRNQVLDRMFACPICDEEFETYNKDKIRAHCRLHQQQLQEAGQCPSCGDPQWAFMTNHEKRIHFATHQDRHESAKIKRFYESHQCPVCDMDLSKTEPEQVIRHCLEHSSGQIQFCDRCGLNEKDCNAEELNHHHFKCRLADDRQAGDPEPVFCKDCGLNTTRATPKQNQTHLKQCREGTPRRFCARCGLNETAHHWNAAAIAKHDSHCRPPSGFNKKFCQKCSTEVASLDAAATTHHRMTCRQVEPPNLSERSRLIELKKRQDIARVSEARLNAHKAAIDNREQDLDAREEMLVMRENDVREKLSNYDGMKSEIERLKPTPPGLHHAESFLCPLENAYGNRCNCFISLKDDGFDITVHYNHKLSDDEQEAAQDRVNEKLRATIRAAQRQVASDVAFIGKRGHMSAITSSTAATTSPQTTKNTAPTKDAAEALVQHHRTPRSPAAATTPSVSPGLWNQDKSIVFGRPATSEDIRIREARLKSIAQGAERRDAAVTTRGARAAGEAPAAVRKRRASVSEQVYKPLGEDDSTAESDVPRPPLKKKGRPAKAVPVKAAPTKVASATSNNRNQLQAAEVVSVTKKKAPAKAVLMKPTKTTPGASKKRKQANEEEEFTVTKKSLRNAATAAPVKKKLKKAEDTVVVETSKSAIGSRKRRRTRLSGGRGPSRVWV